MRDSECRAYTAAMSCVKKFNDDGQALRKYRNMMQESYCDKYDLWKKYWHIGKGRGMKVFVSYFIFFLFSCVFVNADARSQESNARGRLTQYAAKQVAERKYSEATSGVVKRFKCRLSDQSPVNWYFVCKNLDEVPRLDTDGFVTIKKNSGAATVSLGG